MPLKFTMARSACIPGRWVRRRCMPFQANQGNSIAILTAMRQNTISNVDIVSDRMRTDVCADENRNIEKTAIRTPLRTVGDARSTGCEGPRVVMWASYRVSLNRGELFVGVRSLRRFA